MALGLAAGLLVPTGKAVAASSRAADGAASVCDLPEGYSARIERLLSRTKELEGAYQRKDAEEVMAFYDPDEMSGAERRAGLRQLRRNVKYTGIAEWIPRRILQCGNVAGVMIEVAEWETVSGMPRVRLMQRRLSSRWWVWKGGEWLLTEEPSHTLTGGERLLNLDDEWVWLEKPFESFWSIWPQGDPPTRIASAPTYPVERPPQPLIEVLLQKRKVSRACLLVRLAEVLAELVLKKGETVVDEFRAPWFEDPRRSADKPFEEAVEVVARWQRPSFNLRQATIHGRIGEVDIAFVDEAAVAAIAPVSVKTLWLWYEDFGDWYLIEGPVEGLERTKPRDALAACSGGSTGSVYASPTAQGGFGRPADHGDEEALDAVGEMACILGEGVLEFLALEEEVRGAALSAEEVAEALLESDRKVLDFIRRQIGGKRVQADDFRVDWIEATDEAARASIQFHIRLGGSSDPSEWKRAMAYWKRAGSGWTVSADVPDSWDTGKTRRVPAASIPCSTPPGDRRPPPGS